MNFNTRKTYLYLALSATLSMGGAYAETVSIDNPGFESNTDFDGWNDDDPSAISGDSYSGSNSAKITGSGGRVDQTVPLTANTDYVLTAYVEGSGEIGINLGSSTESTKSTSSDWSEVTVSFNSGSATSGEIFGKYYNGEGRFDDFSLESSGTTNTGSAASVPGVIQAEDYDSYYDTTSANRGGEYRTDAVDIQATGDAGGGYNVGWIAAGEWLEYNIDVDSTASYTLDARVASSRTTGSFIVEVDGSQVGDEILVGNTGGFQSWTTKSIDLGQLSAGSSTLRVYATGSSFNLNWYEINETEEVNTGSSYDELSIATAFDYGTSHGSFPPSKAIDNNTAWASRWAAQDGGSAVDLVVQLDEVKEVKDVGISWGQGHARTHTFEIYGRAGTSGSWTKIADAVSSGESTDIEVYNVTDIDARQILIKAQQNSAGTNWMNITEVKLYGIDSSGNNGDYGNECEASGQILYDGVCDEYSEVFEAEHGEIGEDDHIISLSPIEMTFDALAAQHVTENGNGWRHELKIKSSGDYRVGMTEVYEEFKATITANLDDGAKTIVAQHHAADTATITKLYIADLDEGGFENAPDGTESDSVAMNGIFDVYIRLADPDSDGETKHLLTTIRSGESFDFEEINDHGVVTVTINGLSLDPISVDDSSDSYFKFGNYQQAQNPETNVKLASGDADGDWADFFEEYFDTSEITFTEMSYTRTVD